MTEQHLEKWETWPLWALGLANGANISLWYVMSMLDVNTADLFVSLPGYVKTFLPHLIVLGGLAAAGSLDGVLVATLAGVRAGRSGWWTWATLVSAAAFSALISYALHAGKIGDWPWLHMAMMAVMLPYNFHLSQPRKALQSVEKPVGSDSYQSKPDFIGVCKSCGGHHDTLTEYSACARRKRQVTDIPDPLLRAVTTSTQGFDEGRRNGVNH